MMCSIDDVCISVPLPAVTILLLPHSSSPQDEKESLLSSVREVAVTARNLPCNDVHLYSRLLKQACRCLLPLRYEGGVGSISHVHENVVMASHLLLS